MNRIAVTGATGFIGLNFIKFLSSKGVIVYPIVRETSDINNLKKIVCEENIVIYRKTAESLLEELEDKNINAVVHLATYYTPEHQLEDIDNLVESNILYGLHLVEVMTILGINKLVNIGTTWDKFAGHEYNPVNLYAATKKGFEDILKYYHEVRKLNVIHLKIYDTYGPNDQRRKVFYLLKASQEKHEGIDFSPGDQIIGMIHIDDVIEGIYTALVYLNECSNTYETYYLNPSEWKSLREIAEVFEEVTRKKININWGRKPYRDREVMSPVTGDVLPGWKAKIKLKEGLAKSGFRGD